VAARKAGECGSMASWRMGGGRTALQAACGLRADGAVKGSGPCCQRASEARAERLRAPCDARQGWAAALLVLDTGADLGAASERTRLSPLGCAMLATLLRMPKARPALSGRPRGWEL
jgi:hypothetical protein